MADDVDGVDEPGILPGHRSQVAIGIDQGRMEYGVCTLGTDCLPINYGDARSTTYFFFRVEVVRARLVM